MSGNLSGSLNAGLGASGVTVTADLSEPFDAFSFNLSTTLTLGSLPDGVLVGPLANLAFYEGSPGPNQIVPAITFDWYSGAGAGLAYIEINCENGVPAGSYGQAVRVAVGAPTVQGSTLTLSVSGTLTREYVKDTLIGPQAFCTIDVQTTGGNFTWTDTPIGYAGGSVGAQSATYTQSIGSAVVGGTFSGVTDPLATLTLNPLTPTILVPLALTGSAYVNEPTALEYQVDQTGPWLAVGSYIEGWTWQGAGPAAVPGFHTIQVRDANNPTVVSNFQSYFLNAITLNLISAVPFVAPAIGGFDYEAEVATAMEMQINRSGVWIAVGAPFVGAEAPDGTWSALMLPEGPGTYIVQVRNANVPTTVSNEISYTISQNGGSYEELPVWSVQPDWANGLLERFEWLTDVLQSITGAEQRVMLRLSPRRTLELQTVVFRTERTLYDLALKTNGDGDWYVPVWPDVVRLASTLTTAQTIDDVIQPSTFTVETEGHEYFPGGLLLLYGSCFSYEIVVIAEVSAGMVTLAAAPLNNWPPGTRVMPLFRASLSEEPTAARYGDRALVATVGWTSKASTQFPSNLTGTDSYQGYPVLTVAPDEAAQLNYKFERIKTDFDPTTGQRLVADTAGFGFGTQQFSWFVAGYRALSQLRGLLYSLAGKLKPIWIPTYYSDFELVNPIAATDTTLTIAQCGYTFFNCSKVYGRQNIRIELENGSSVYCNITGSTQSGTNEIVQLSSEVGQAIPLNAVKRVSFLSLCRQNSDTVEFEHKAAGGVATVTQVYREAPDTRQIVFVLLDPAKTSGGKVSGSGFYFRNGPTDGPVISKSVQGFTTGQYWVECSIALASTSNVGFGVCTLAATVADINNNATNAAMCLSQGTSVNLCANGTVGAAMPAFDTTPVYIGVAIDLDANLAWFLTEYDYTSQNPVYNNDPNANPLSGVGGVDLSWRGTNPLYLCVQLNSNGTAGANASVNGGQAAPFVAAPAGFLSAWAAS